MKAVMISIRPAWVEKIVSGEKTIEVRKTAPKIDTPFKCYIYATKSGDRIILKNDKVYEISKSLTGKVVGEFICDQVVEFESEFADDDCYESIGVVWYDDGERIVSIFTDNKCTDFSNNKLCEKSCVPLNELKRYVGVGVNTFYGWYISDLKIYDTPKEISEFRKPCDHQCYACGYYTAEKCFDGLTRPPESWCYVEEL